MTPCLPPPPGTPEDLIEADDVRLLAEIGFLALSKGLTVEAERIFEGIAAVRPGQEVSAIGRGLTALAKGDANAAVTILRAGPKTDAVATYLALALAKAGETDAAKAQLTDIAEMALDPTFAAVARDAAAEI
ncbi:MAG: hypothetical protein AAF318_01260 [Pseudomonadota bacterium]